MTTIIVCSEKVNWTKLSKFINVSKAQKIAVDKGYKAFNSKIVPDALYGDFDSIDIKKVKLTNVIHKNSQDLSDLEFTLKQQPKKDTLVVITSGNRWDHQLANFNLLWNYNFYLINDSNIAMSGKEFKDLSFTKMFKYFSVFVNEPTKLTIKNAKYELNNSLVNPNNTLAISNEPKANILIKANKKVIVVFSND